MSFAHGSRGAAVARLVLLLGLVLAVTAMHHLVGAGPTVLESVSPGHASAHVPAGGPETDVADVPVVGSTAAPAVPAPPGGHGHHDGLGMLLHLCLAVLAAGLALALVAHSVVGRRPAPAAPSRAPPAPRAVVEHPPPVADRLALLQLLRI